MMLFPKPKEERREKNLRFRPFKHSPKQSW
jgi:hypothetical protein